MRFKIYFLVIYGFIQIYAYTIPEVKLDLKQTGFQISVPDEAGITEVVYVIEINDICSAIMDYLSKPEYGMWSARQQNITLRNNDRVSVTLMVVHNDSIYLVTENFEIKNGKPNKVVTTVAKTNNVEDFITECVTDQNTNQVLCQKTQTVSTTANVQCADDLIFEENFDNTNELDLSRWSYDIYSTYGNKLNIEFVLFDNSTENCFVSDGSLNIVPTITPKVRPGVIDLSNRCTSTVRGDCHINATLPNVYLPALCSSQINTKNFFTFKYGRIDIRAKLPVGNWLLPYIMLKPVSPSAYQIENPQIRIAFARGNENLMDGCCERDTGSKHDIGGKHLYAGIVYWNKQIRIENFKKFTAKNHFGENFHNYSISWTGKSISMSVDGEIYGTINEGLQYFASEFYISIGLSAGGWEEYGTSEDLIWDRQDSRANLHFWMKQKQWIPSWKDKGSMKIDYVRVYTI